MNQLNIKNKKLVKYANQKKSPLQWSWVLMMLFLTLGILDIRFGVLGLACMIAPLYHVFKGEGKIHCRSYCPRGSLLGRFLERISLNRQMPKYMTTKSFKNVLLLLMLLIFSIAMIHAAPSWERMAFSLFRFMVMSLLVGIVMGIFFKPRSWCVVCPMGYGAGLVDQKLKNIKFL